MADSYEIEIKTLLGNKENADALVQKMHQTDPALQMLGTHKQLNHYFVGGDLKVLAEKAKNIVAADKAAQFQDLCAKAKDFSLRTRLADQKLILVIKASVDDTTSSNGTARLEFESEIAGMDLDQLDKIILDSGFQYQAKWSRERTEYSYKGATVSIDKNAGYGYLSEFEMIAQDPAQTEQLKSLIREMMDELGVKELPQDRLARMFDFYNKNWQDYYGTDKVFNIE